MSRGDEQAFPTLRRGYYGLEADAKGITLREYYAGLAMQGIIAGDLHSKCDPESVARAALVFADALLADLEAKKP